jgi:surface protein
MNIYDNNKQLLSTLGVEGNFSTDFEVRKAILTALGGDATECNTIYEVDTQILKIYEEGGGGSGSDVLDLSGKTDFSRMFANCKNLVEAPKMITPDGTSFNSMFSGCTALTTVSQLDTSNGTDLSRMFYNCSSLITAPQLDTSNGTTFNLMFAGCTNLVTVPLLDISIATNVGSIFGGYYTSCPNLTNVTVTGSINVSIDFSNNTLLSYESVKSILTACSNTTNTNAKTLIFKRTLTDQNGELATLVSTCTSKGWTITGLTLN